MTIIAMIFELYAYVTLTCGVYAAITLGLAKLITNNEDDWMIVSYCFGLILFLAVVGFLLFRGL